MACGVERAKFARVDPLLTSLSCPVCFETVKDCVITPCGHSFCRTCAGDAVSRKHVCPVCQGAVVGGEVALIRNFLVDEVTQTVRKAAEETDVAYMRLLFASASEGQALPNPPPLRLQSSAKDAKRMGVIGAEDTKQVLPVPAMAPKMLSPIESVLVNRMREAFLGYQAYYARERAAHEAEVASLLLQLTAERANEGSSTVQPAEEHTKQVQALEIAIDTSKKRFQTCMDALLKDFDSHAAAVAPPPSLLPSTVTVIVASRGVRFDTQLLPTHFPENVYGKVRAYFAAAGDEVKGFGPGTRLFLQALSVTATTITNNHSGYQPQTHAITSATETVFSQSPGGRIGAGWALVVDGAVFLASEEIKPCFAQEYGQPGRDPEELVDYFTCGQCQLNWVCASCAAHCHRNCLDVRPFSLNHKPTWACCYCSKKKAKSGCKLADGVEAAGAARLGK